MDTNDVEIVTFNALGGVDNITVGDLTGTDVTRFKIDLGGTVGQIGDGQADTITDNGTQAADTIRGEDSERRGSRHWPADGGAHCRR